MRVPLKSDFTPVQYALVQRLGKGESSAVIMDGLKLSRSLYRYHLSEAAKKIPGTLSPTARIIGWWRGADKHILGAR